MHVNRKLIIKHSYESRRTENLKDLNIEFWQKYYVRIQGKRKIRIYKREIERSEPLIHKVEFYDETSEDPIHIIDINDKYLTFIKTFRDLYTSFIDEQERKVSISIPVCHPDASPQIIPKIIEFLENYDLKKITKGKKRIYSKNKSKKIKKYDHDFFNSLTGQERILILRTIQYLDIEFMIKKFSILMANFIDKNEIKCKTPEETQFYNAKRIAETLGIPFKWNKVEAAKNLWAEYENMNLILLEENDPYELYLKGQITFSDDICPLEKY